MWNGFHVLRDKNSVTAVLCFFSRNLRLQISQANSVSGYQAISSKSGSSAAELPTLCQGKRTVGV